MFPELRFLASQKSRAYLRACSGHLCFFAFATLKTVLLVSAKVVSLTFETIKENCTSVHCCRVRMAESGFQDRSRDGNGMSGGGKFVKLINYYAERGAAFYESLSPLEACQMLDSALEAMTWEEKLKMTDYFHELEVMLEDLLAVEKLAWVDTFKNFECS